MNNEEKNLTPENEGVEENKPTESTEAVGGKKLSGGMLAAIIGGAAVIIAVILLLILLPGAGKNNGNNGEGSGDNSGETGGETETKVTYTVTVVDQDGNPVKGAIINLYQGSLSIPYSTGADGKTEGYRTDKKIEASVFFIPESYTYNKMNQKQSFDKNGNLTITLTKVEVNEEKLVILVVDQNDNPIAGVSVQMCDKAGLCKPGGATDAEGKYYYTFSEGDFRAQITGGKLPEGYTVADPLAYYDFVDGVAKIVLTKTAD